MSHQPNPGKKRPSITAGIIGGVIGIYVVRTYVFPTKSRAEGLAEVSAKLNKSLPKMVDEMTRWDTTSSGPGNVFNYRMTILGQQWQSLDREALRTWTESQLAQNYRTKPEMEPMRNLGTVLSYHYSDESGALIFDIEIDP